ncbi:hypothetical protein KAM497c_43890 (plasmid) [Aeromonas caviae]|nr:hypothetical protein KAM497c_43890 [Aeromonas caviae]
MRLVHHVQPLAHDRLKHQVLSDGFAGRLVEVLADGVDTPHKGGLWIFASEIDHAPGVRRGQSYKVAACHTASD